MTNIVQGVVIMPKQTDVSKYHKEIVDLQKKSIPLSRKRRILAGKRGIALIQCIYKSILRHFDHF